MPFALVAIGLILVVTGARGTMRELGNELKTDFTGPGNFVWWIVSIGFIGSLGYIDELKGFSRWFMTLIVIAMVISNRGFFDKFIAALRAGPQTPDTISDAPNNLESEKKTFATNSIAPNVATNIGDIAHRISLIDLKPIGP